MNVDGDIVDDGCDEEVLCNCVAGKKRVSGKAGEGDRVVNEGDESSSTRIGMAVLTGNGVVVERVGEEDEMGFQFGFLYTGSKDIFRVKEE